MYPRISPPYLDLDGVLFDFDRAARDVLGADPNDVDDAIMWPKLLATPQFFRNLPLFDGAKHFVAELTGRYGPPVILTACTKSAYAETARQKIAAVREHFGDLIVLPVWGGVNKVLFKHGDDDILIDDHHSNCRAWREGGGYAVQHVDFETTWRELTAIHAQRREAYLRPGRREVSHG